MKELTHHLCKRLVAEHYASLGARTGSDSGWWVLPLYAHLGSGEGVGGGLVEEH